MTHPLADEVTARLLEELRGRCPQLQDLSINPPSERSEATDLALGRFGSQLRVLTYDDVRTWTIGWIEMLHALPSLEHLDGVGYGCLEAENERDVESPAFQLKSFHGWGEYSHDFLYLILRNSYASLISLDIPSATNRGQAWDLSPFVALKSLDLLLREGQVVELGAGDHKGILYTIGTCPKLVSLKLTTFFDVYKVTTLSAEKPFLHLLPSTLRDLDIGEIQVSDDHVFDALANLATLPALSTLVLADSTQIDDAREEEFITYWTSSRRQKKVRRQIEKACEARSIKLEWKKWKQGERVD